MHRCQMLSLISISSPTVTVPKPRASFSNVGALTPSCHPSSVRASSSDLPSCRLCGSAVGRLSPGSSTEHGVGVITGANCSYTGGRRRDPGSRWPCSSSVMSHQSPVRSSPSKTGEESGTLGVSWGAKVPSMVELFSTMR